MASVIHLDTHAFIWFHDGDLQRFPAPALPLLRQSTLVVSPMVRLELHYLREVGKLTAIPDDMLADMQQRVGLTVFAGTFTDVIAEAARLTWTRDPFDRLITATARAAKAPLLTKDPIILANESTAFWDRPPP